MNSRKPTCSVIIVTYNSEKFIHKAMACLREQTTPPDQIIIVDTGSADLAYLHRYRECPNTLIIEGEKEIGFCRGNNLGMKYVASGTDYVLLVNPDAFLTPPFIRDAILFMENPDNQSCGILTGMVYGYSIENDIPTGVYDTTGVFQKWYGKWVDRGQGIECAPELYMKIEAVPAICGALMFCRKKALDDVLIRGGEIFDSSFYMYKEDIDLSLRLRRKGWQLYYNPELKAYHCRGWNPDRSKMARKIRLCSAKNELIIHLKEFSPFGIIYSMLKYATVAIFNI